MTKQELLNIIIESVNSTNLEICRNANMPEEQIKTYFEQSADSMSFVMARLVDTLVEKGLVAAE